MNCVPVATVAGWRKKLAKPAAPRDYTLLPKANPSPLDGRNHAETESLDWSKPNSVLAKESGVTREWIRQKRAQLGKPKMLAHHFKFNAFRDAFANTPALSFADARSKFPTLAGITFVTYCGRLNIKRLRTRKHTKWMWDKMNWSLPNKILSQVWGVKTHTVAVHRCNHNLPRPGFIFVHTETRTSEIPSEWLSVIEAEKKKASNP